jgi:hypothetical protein
MHGLLHVRAESRGSQLRGDDNSLAASRAGGRRSSFSSCTRKRGMGEKGEHPQWNSRIRFSSASIAARILSSRPVNRSFSTTSSSATSPSVARLARTSALPCLELHKDSPISTTRLKRVPPARHAARKPPCLLSQRKAGRYFAANASSSDGTLQRLNRK